jgi:cation:H+ antiporter
VSSFVSLALLVGGIVLVVAGAELFFDGLLAAAARFGVSAFLLTVVVSGFELENLAAGIAANAKGLPDAAAGTFLGGTTFLALAVAGLGAVFAPLRAQMPAGVLLWTAVAPLPLLGLALDGDLSRLDGGILVAWFGLAMVGLWRSGRQVLESAPAERKRFALLRVFIGLAVLTAAGDMLGEGIRRAVSRFGVSQALLGNTAVAASVEAEEVARVAAPARRGRGDVALGNIVGTIVHFIAFNSGVIALVRPLDLGSDSRWLHMPVAVASPLVLVGLIAWRGGLGRTAGVFLLLLYAAYVAASVAVSLL